MKSLFKAVATAAIVAVGYPVVAFADETPAAEGDAGVHQGNVGGPGWESLPKKERVAREWRSLPRAERIARERNGKRPPILDEKPSN